MAINLGQRSSSLGSGRVEFHPDRPVIHFGSPSEHEYKKRALEDFYGTDVPDSTVRRVRVRDADDQVSPFVD